MTLQEKHYIYKENKHNTMIEMTLGLCENRHESSVELDGYIFPQVLDVKDFDKMKDIIFEKLINCKKLNLYVTGLTVALVEVYGFCVHNNIPLTLYHYDRETGGYYIQEANTSNKTEQAIIQTVHALKNNKV